MDTIYEDGLIGFLAAKLSHIKTVEDYLIYSCKFSPETGHDIIARVKLKGVWYLLLVQARNHDEFNSDEFKKIPDQHRDVLAGNVRFIIFCNTKLEAVVSPGKGHVDSAGDIDELILLFGENHRQLNRDSHLFLKRFNCLKNQANIEEEIWRYLGDYFQDEYLRNQGLTKDIFEMEVQKNKLQNIIVHPRLSVALAGDARIDIWNKIAINNAIIFINNEGDDDIESCLYQCCVNRINNDLLKIDIDWDVYVGEDRIFHGTIVEKFRQYSAAKSWRSWIHPPEDFKSLMIELWKYGDLPLILNADTDLRACLNRNYIVVNSSVCSTGINEIEDETLRNDILENSLISLQGRAAVPLDELVPKTQITLKDIILLMRENPPIIGREICYGGDDYIPRNLQVPSIYNSYFTLNETKICLVSGDVETLNETIEFLAADLDDISELLSEPKSYFIKIDNKGRRRDLWRKLSPLGYPILDFHIRYGIMELLRYQNCDIKDLGPYSWQCRVPEGYFFENLGEMDRIIVITGDPGIGKSAFLKSLFNKATTTDYIIFYDLNRIQNDVTQPIQTITTEFILERFHEGADVGFGNFIRNLGLTLILDSFDDVMGTIYESEIIKFIKSCDAQRVIIGSRQAGLNLLRTCLDLQAIKLDQFDDGDIRKYSAKLKLGTSMLEDLPEDFTANPSHLNCLKMIPEENLDTLTLYEKVIDVKIRDSLRSRPSSMTLEEIKSLFEKLALIAVFGEGQIKERFNWVTTQTPAEILKFGIVTHYDESNSIPEFYGFTLEFFLSRWFVAANQSGEHKSLIADLYKLMLDEGDLNLLNLTYGDLNLHKAIVRGDVYKVMDLCQEDGNSLNTPDNLGRLPIHLATIRCRHQRRNTPYFILGEIIRSMQRHGYDLGQLDAILGLDWVAYMTVDMFERIFYYDRIEIVQIYLNYEKQCKNRLLPRFLSIYFREAFVMGLKHFSIDLLHDLLSLGGTQGNLTPLHVACLRGSPTMIGELIEVDSKLNFRDDFYYTPLDYSTFWACAQIKPSFKLILPEDGEPAPPPMYKQHQNITLLELLIKNGADDCSQQNDNPKHYHTPLCVAARSGHLDAVKIFLKTKIRSHLCGEDCQIRLHIAAITQNVDLIKLLTRVDTNLNSRDDYHNAPLHYAVETGNVGIVNMLLNIRTDINARNNSRETALHRAVKKRSVDIIEALLKAGANANLQNRRGETPLHYALKLKHEKIADKIQIVTDHNVRNIENGYGDIPLYTAEKMPSADKTRLSLIIGAVVDSNLSEFDRSSERSTDIVKILLQSGADCKIRDMNRVTPLDYAVEMRDDDTIELFVRRKKRRK